MNIGPLASAAIAMIVSASEGMYSARVIADSITAGVRLTTLEVVFPRFILAEFNTHRMFSRNSASSRAIPVERRIAQVWNTPFVPEAFGVNKSGMQASANLGGWRATIARWTWLTCSRVCVVLAWLMSKLGVHKQHANRLIELFAWHTVVVSSTEWDNFFALRDHKAAQPEMQITARLMKDVYNRSKPVLLKPGEWHVPYTTDSDREELQGPITAAYPGEKFFYEEHAWTELIKRSVVRCAAVSFERQYADRTADQYDKRHNDMMTMAHWSPFEHQAQAGEPIGMLHHQYAVDSVECARCGKHAMPCAIGPIDFDPCEAPVFIGNFRAPWRQYRKTFKNESVFKG